MWPLRTIFYFASFWVACALSLVNPFWGVVNYLLIYQMDPQGTWWGKPISDFGVRYSLYAIAFTLLGMILSPKRIPKLKSKFSGWEMLLLAMLAVAAINIVQGLEFGPRAQYAFEKLWKTLVFVFIMVRLATTRENFRLLIWALVLGSLYLGYDANTAPESSFITGRLNHIGGTDFSTTSGFAAHLTAMLPIIGVALLIAKTWRLRALALLSGGLCVNAIILCRTRSAFIGWIIGALAAFLLAPRARRYRIHGALVAGVAMAFVLTDSPFWERMATMASAESLTSDPAAETRLALWATSFDILSDHPLGIGIGNFPGTIGQYDWSLNKRSSHNTLLVAFVELGIIGGTIFLLLFFVSLYYAFRCSRMAQRCHEPLETTLAAYGLLVSCVTYFVTGLGTERFLCESFWWVLALPLCLYRVVIREVAELEADPVAVTHSDHAIDTPYLTPVEYA